jgi:hypothetical protein
MPESTAAPTRRLAIIFLAAAGVAALAISLYLVFGDTREATVGPSTYSRSAIGHDVLLEMLQRAGIDATASRGASVQKVRHGGLLVLAEPDFDNGGKPALQRLLLAKHVLLILPKWDGSADDTRRGWLSLAAPVPLPLAQTTLDDAGLDATVVRPDRAPALDFNRLGPTAHLEAPQQLMRAPALEPLVAGPAGMLIGRRTVGGRELFVLSDPDIIANHGMAAGNAALAVALIDRARYGGPVIFDETIHGFSTVPTGALRLLYARPFLAATLNALLACGLLVWAGATRFGTILQRPAALRPGKLALIDNITDLLLDAGQQADLLRRYVMVTIDDVAARLHAPELAGSEARAAWLARAQKQRGMTRDAATIAARARAAAITGRRDRALQFAVAEDAYLWKQEILHGSTGAGTGRGRDPRGNPQGRGGSG